MLKRVIALLAESSYFRLFSDTETNKSQTNLKSRDIASRDHVA